jgi:hypothetical protein
MDKRFRDLDVVALCQEEIRKYFENQLHIGEPVYITRLYSILGKVDGVADVRSVRLVDKKGLDYSPVSINFKEAMSSDGTYLATPKNAIMELKYPKKDIKGTLVR